MMMTADPVQKVLVLRSPQVQGNYTYRMAVLPDEEPQKLKECLIRGQLTCLPELGSKFGEPLTLSEVMERLKVRDFCVVDLPDWK